MIRTYTELARITTFEERYAYVRVPSSIGLATFGFDRWLNQAFYTSREWRHVRQAVIARDRGCDLGVEDYPLWDRITIHHLNPIKVEELESGDPAILDPEFLISVSNPTHNAIHFGKEVPKRFTVVERRPGDTRLWLGEIMIRTMYDGINSDARAIARIIKPGEGVAYYIDGRYAWSGADIALFPDNFHVTITVLGNAADVADCETGDMTPAEAAAWVGRQRNAGYFRPTVYRSLAVMDDIRKATGSLVMGQDWDSWVADYDNDPKQVYPGAAAHQYRSTFDKDISSVFLDGWPFRKSHVTVPPPRTAKPKWPAGLILKKGDVGHSVEAMQTAFRNSGIRGLRGITVDGVFGTQTLVAVRNFQEEEHIGVDGRAGKDTRTRLIATHLLNIDGTAA
jgi:hypothetical protein